MPVVKIATPLLLGALLLGSVHAQERPELQPVPEPPPLPQRVRSGEVLEPEVTIIQREEEAIHEYRINGQLLAIKVVPRNGPAYYLIDADGDGSLETFREELGPDFLIPAWVLFSW